MNSQQMTKEEYRVVDGHCHSSISGQSCFAVVVLFHTEKNSYYTYWWEILLLYKDINYCFDKLKDSQNYAKITNYIGKHQKW